jgi:hypothetical protein
MSAGTRHKGEVFRHRSDSVTSLRNFCRAEQGTGRAIVDPLAALTHVGQLRCSKPMQCGLKTGSLGVSPRLPGGFE